MSHRLNTEQPHGTPPAPETGLPAALHDKERSLIGELKNKGTVAAVAFSIFMGASTASAEENIQPPTTPDRISLSLPFGGEPRILAGLHLETIASPQDDYYYGEALESNLYKNLSKEEMESAHQTLKDAINNSANAKEFFVNLMNQKDVLNNLQKIILLQNLGISLPYNYDMLDNRQFVKVSDDAMFSGLKDLKTGGICGNIHTFIIKAAEQLGIEAWLQSGEYGDTGHIFAGMVVEADGKKQIVFLNYGDLITTGTLNYRDALGVAERYMGNVGIFVSDIGDKDKYLFPIRSRALGIVERAVGIEDTADRLQEGLAKTDKQPKPAFEIKISPDVVEIKLNNNALGLTIFNFHDAYDNPYQSLRDLRALRIGKHLPGELLNVDVDATILHMDVKNMQEGVVANEVIVARLAADYINSHDLTKEQYGNLLLNWGGTIQTAIAMQLAETHDLQGSLEGEWGARLIYINPTDTNKFYMGASIRTRLQHGDMQDQEITIREVAKTFNVGATVKTNEVTVTNLEASVSTEDWGNKSKITSEVKSGDWSARAKYEKDWSKYERFIPSAEKMSAEVGYRGPKYKIDILGFQNTEKYKDDENRRTAGAEVKLTIFLW